MQGNVSKVKITPEIAEKLKELREENIFLDGLAKVQNIGENRSINGPTTTGTVVFNDDGYTLTGVCDVRRRVNNCPVGQAVGGEGTTLSLEIDLPGGNGGRIFYVYSQEQGVEGRNPIFGFAYTTQGYRLLSNFSTSLSNDQYYNDKIYKGTVSVWVFIKGGDFELYVDEERISKVSTGTNLANRWYYGFRTYLGTEAVTIKNMKYSKGNAVRKTLITSGQVQNKVTLPEGDRDENDLYCVLDGELWYNDIRQNQNHANIVDGLPPSGDVLTEDMNSITIYYNIRDEKVWCWLNDEMAAMMGGEEGWYEAEAVLDAMHEAGLTDIEWAGVCDYRSRHTVDDKMRMIVVARYFRFLNGQWVTLSEGIGYPGEAQGAEKFNGIDNNATGFRSHAEGSHTKAGGDSSHAEGSDTEANGNSSHAEGYNTKANGDSSHAEGNITFANGHFSHAEGYKTEAGDDFSHAEGYNTKANGVSSHAEGYETKVSVDFSHAEGKRTDAAGEASHAEGKSDHKRGDYVTNDVLTAAVAAANKTTRSDSDNTKIQDIIATWDHQAEGDADQKFSVAAGDFSHAEGTNALVIAKGAHAEGNGCVAAGKSSHAEGTGARATGHYSHAGGLETMASADYSFAHGYRVMATGKAAVAIGYNTHDPYTEPNASATGAIAIGRDAKADAFGAIAIGSQVKANRENQVVVGVHNDQSSTAKFVIGNGTGTDSKSNSFEVDADGNVWCAGSMEAADGLILKAPNGTKYKITVANDGTLQTTALT